MLSTDLALITSAKSHIFVDPSWTKTFHLAKVSGQYLQRPGSLSCTKNYDFLFFVYRNLEGSRVSGYDSELRSLSIDGTCSFYKLISSTKVTLRPLIRVEATPKERGHVSKMDSSSLFVPSFWPLFFLFLERRSARRLSANEVCVRRREGQ